MNDPDIILATSTHDGLEISPLGNDVIAHPISPIAKFVPEMLTRVLARPEAGDSVIFGVNRNGADLEVPLGSEVTITVETPGTAVPVTVNEPVTTPPVIEHVCADTILGEEVILQVASAGGKPVPLTDTMVPVGPELGFRLKADADFVKAVVEDTNPSELWNMTEYNPGATVPETTKLPVIWNVAAEMLQDTAVGSPSGELYKEAQPAAASAALKPEPATDTSVKDSPLVGFSVIVGVTAKLPVPTFPAAVTTVTVQVPPCALALTVKEAVRAPEELTVQVGVGTPAKRFDPAGAVMLLHAP